MKAVLINKINSQIIVCVIENNKIAESYVFSKAKKHELGDIYVGKVDKILEGMQSAFVDIGEERKAFISLKDAIPKIDITTEEYDKEINISGVLKEGQTILAQIKKESSENKGARISTHITLPGKYIVLMPETSIMTISQKIENELEKNRLKEITKKKLPENYGAIIRTEALNVEEKLIQNDIEILLEKWYEIKKEYDNIDTIKLLYSEHEIESVLYNEFIDKNIEKIYVNDKEIYEMLKSKNVSLTVDLYENEDLLDKFGLYTEYMKINNKKVWLKCGGNIVVEKTEALTAIDVNSGKYLGKENLEETAYKVNLEAAIEIMRQLRLKDIGGIIVIDFIDMIEEKHKDKILEIMKQEAKKDRSKVNIYEFTKLNLVEITRKKYMVK